MNLKLSVRLTPPQKEWLLGLRLEIDEIDYACVTEPQAVNIANQEFTWPAQDGEIVLLRALLRKGVLSRLQVAKPRGLWPSEVRAWLSPAGVKLLCSLILEQEVQSQPKFPKIPTLVRNAWSF